MNNISFAGLENWAGDIELMKLLLSKGVNVESESDAGTPLVWVAGHAQQDAVKLLLQHSAKVGTSPVHPLSPD
jgi:ankyrin repeat protein